MLIGVVPQDRDEAACLPQSIRAAAAISLWKGLFSMPFSALLPLGYGRVMPIGRKTLGCIAQQSLESEGAEVHSWLDAKGKGAERFPDGGRVLETVARTGRGDDDIGKFRMPVDDETCVRRDRVEACDRVQTAVRHFREIRGDIGFMH